MHSDQHAVPAPELVIRRRPGFVPVDLAELWRCRELLLFFAWRDILVRYKQTAVGIAWAVIQPVLTMVVLTAVFQKLAGCRSAGAPYSVMTLAAVLPWQFFATALGQGSESVVQAANLIRRTYFPRMIIPLAAMLSGLADFGIALAVLLGMLAWHGIPLTARILWLPVFLLLGATSALALSLWLSALNVRYRDVKHVVPFLVRIGLYVSPVGFMSAAVPDRWRLAYHLNPMVGVIDGFRWAVLGPAFEPCWPGVALSALLTAAVLAGGACYFRHTERTFADVI